jgi:tRNA (cytidine/uridine-2'-O-)-methyltransferase
MVHVVLYEPEIPPNTGNIIRLCANSGNQLHLVKPLGFDLDDKRLRRAGLDYHEWVDVSVHDKLENLLKEVPHQNLYAISTKGTRNYSEPQFAQDDLLLFGPETRGLPAQLLASLNRSQVLRIPMRPGSRSMNLSNATAIIIYEVWRQSNFAGAS